MNKIIKLNRENDALRSKIDKILFKAVGRTEKDYVWLLINTLIEKEIEQEQLSNI